MKVLVDTCVWFLLLRRKQGTVLSADEQGSVTLLRGAIRDGRVAIIGPIRQEVLWGIEHWGQFVRLRAALGRFSDETLTEVHFEQAARLFTLCQSKGVGCGATAILLCAVAIERGFELLTTDRGLKRCAQVLRAEGLMR